MNDSLTNLLSEIEPKIKNIQENRIEKKALQDVYETIHEIVDLGEKSYLEILDYYDQEFIFKAIKIGNKNADMLIDKYKTCRYLLRRHDASLRDLPQYKESISYMEYLYKYLYDLDKKIKLEFDQKIEVLEVQELLNKYYGLLSKENIFIKDIPEFLEFLDINKINLDDRLNILILINKKNIKNYITTNDIKIAKNISLSNVTNLLNTYSDLLNKDYINDENLNLTLDKYVIKNQFDEQAIFNRKIYLIKKIKELYEEKQLLDLVRFYNEFNKILGYEKEFRRQKMSKHKLVFATVDGKNLLVEYLNSCKNVYKSCILKNLLDLEEEKDFILPDLCYNNSYLYLKRDFLVKTIYTYLDNGYILVIGVLGENEYLKDFVTTNEEFLNQVFDNIATKEFDLNERNQILKNVKKEDLVSVIDLDTLEINMEEKNAR